MYGVFDSFSNTAEVDTEQDGMTDLQDLTTIKR